MALRHPRGKWVRTEIALNVRQVINTRDENLGFMETA